MTDAERYQWLRRQSLRTIEEIWWKGWVPDKHTWEPGARSAALFDVAVDEAIARSEILADRT